MDIPGLLFGWPCPRPSLRSAKGSPYSAPRWKERGHVPFFVLLLLLAPAGRPALAAAQEAAPKPGDRIRVTTLVVHRRYVGNLVELSHESLRWDSDGAPYSISLDQVANLELGRGDKSNAGKGALTGGAVGLGVGVAVGLVFSGLCGNDLVSDNAECRVGTTAAVGGLSALLGAGVGALIGTGSRSVRWEAVPPAVYRRSP